MKPYVKPNGDIIDPSTGEVIGRGGKRSYPSIIPASSPQSTINKAVEKLEPPYKPLVFDSLADQSATIDNHEDLMKMGTENPSGKYGDYARKVKFFKLVDRNKYLLNQAAVKDGKPMNLENINKNDRLAYIQAQQADLAEHEPDDFNMLSYEESNNGTKFLTNDVRHALQLEGLSQKRHWMKVNAEFRKGK